MPLTRRTAWTTAAAVLAGVLAAVTPASPARAEEVYVRPADGVFRLDGHGWGHGRGLNQWGAQGAASTGVGYREILETYYPGTAVQSIGDVPMRVLIQEDEGVDVRVRYATGLRVRDPQTREYWNLPSGYTDWRLARDSAGFRIQYYSGGWRTWSASGRSAWSNPLQFEGPPMVRLVLPGGVQRDYRGALRIVPNGTGIATVNQLWMELYLRGVVPRESPASFHMEALKAQSVAARSYSQYKREHVRSGAHWDICSTIQCQVYGGARLITSSGTVELEHPRTNEAIAATKWEVRAYGGKAIFAEFSASNGGHSTASATFSYLRAQPDPWDEIASPHHRWEAQVTAAQIERRYPAVGRLQRIRVMTRDGNGEWGGRVRRVVLEGVDAQGRATSVESSGGGIYFANPWPQSSDGLRGSWWRIRGATPTEDFSGSLVGTATRISVRPGHRTAVWFDVRNTGTLDWPVRGAVRSGLHQDSPSYDEGSWITPQRPGSLTENRSRPGAAEVRPGEVARFAFTLAGNGREEGVVTETFSVVWEMKYWMQLSVDLTYRVQLLFAGQLVTTAPDVTVPGHGDAPAWFDVRNTGDMAWPLTAPINVRVLATSPSAGDSWLTSSRPGSIGSNVTRPGATEVAVGEVARFPFRLHGNGRSPASPVTERFSLVWERRANAAVVAPVTYAIRNVFRGTVVGRAGPLLVPRHGYARAWAEVKNTGNMTWPLRGPVRVTASSSSPSRSSYWLTPTRPGLLIRNVSDPAAEGVRPGEVARFAWWIAGNGRPHGLRGTERFGFVFEGVGTLPAIEVSYQVRNQLHATVRGVSSPVHLPTTGSATVLVDVRNDGITPWPVQGMVRLTSGASPSYTAGWVHSRRPAAIAFNRNRPGAKDVRPGELARFSFPMAANGRAPGTSATETFGLLWERNYRFPVYVRIAYTVRDVYSARPAGSARDVVVPRHGTARAWFDVVNTGNVAWPVGGAVRSGSAPDAHAPSWVARSRPGPLTANLSTPGATVVRPGERARFAFDLAGNGRAPGTYDGLFKVVWERVAWFDFATTLRYSIS